MRPRPGRSRSGGGPDDHGDRAAGRLGHPLEHRRVGTSRPDSSRDTADCVVPVRAASSACVNPAPLRARRTSSAIATASRAITREHSRNAMFEQAEHPTVARPLGASGAADDLPAGPRTPTWLPPGRVAVAVTRSPTGVATWNVTSKLPCPSVAVATVVRPRNRCPWPFPLSSHVGLENSSTMNDALGSLESLPVTWVTVALDFASCDRREVLQVVVADVGVAGVVRRDAVSPRSMPRIEFEKIEFPSIDRRGGVLHEDAVAADDRGPVERDHVARALRGPADVVLGSVHDDAVGLVRHRVLPGGVRADEVALDDGARAAVELDRRSRCRRSRFPAPADVPPIVVSSWPMTWTPIRLPSAAVPAAFVPIRLPRMTLSRASIPAPNVFSMRMPSRVVRRDDVPGSPAAVPPIVRCARAVEVDAVAAVLPIASVPVTSVPMKFPWIVSCRRAPG